VTAELETPRGQAYSARLVSLGGKKLDRFDIPNETEASLAVQAVTSRDLAVQSVEAKPASRNPSAPFMTSTLQQEASRKFGFGARQTMNAAQRLYEAGHITYMRTDGIDMAPEAMEAARAEIKDRYGAEYVPAAPRIYKNKAKNAQEAHECIRPTEMSLDASKLARLEADQRKLYDLIWKRTLACQMEGAKLERTTVEIGSADGQVGLRATGQVVLFDGFLKVYEEGRDDVLVEEDDDKRLPQISQGEAAPKRAVTPEQHHTQPPPRYTEASLVKRMEELGIGRPSTYASIVTTIQEREYVRKDKNRLIPEDKGRIVTIFLVNFFRKYVGYEFTAHLEEELDEISAGDLDYREVLARFWRDFSAAIAETSELRISEVLDKLDAALAPQLYPEREDGSDPRACPLCGSGSLHLKTSRTGGFVGCSNYPECRYTRPIGGEDANGGDRVLGEVDGEEISLRSGRFGPYVQRGEATEENKKPPRASLPKGWAADEMDLEKALNAAEPAARDRQAPRRRRADQRQFRPLRPLPDAPQARRGQAGLCQPERSRRRVRDRHEPRGGTDRPEARQSRPGTRRGGQTAEGARRSPRKRRRDQRDGRPLRTIREVGEGQRHPAQGRRSAIADAGTGGGAGGRKGGEGRQGQDHAQEEGGWLSQVRTSLAARGSSGSPRRSMAKPAVSDRVQSCASPARSRPARPARHRGRETRGHSRYHGQSCAG